ncbi:MAG: hypothetical protein KAT11_01685 [Phycisphaerae bacterium]|nr:hypothetical protein [Phycisphaerae bacterium]
MKEQSDRAAKQRTPRWIIILCIAIVAVPVFYILYHNALDNRVKAKLDAIRKAGYPATLEELNDWYVEPPPGENAAEVFLDAFSQYVEPGDKRDELPFFSKFELPPGQEPLPEETKKHIAEFLAENHEMLKLLQQAVAMEHCRYSLDFTEGIALVLPDIGRARSAAWLLCLKAILHAENDEPDLATESINLALGVANSFAKEPIIISQLVRGTCQAMAVSSLERVLQGTQLTDEQLAKLATALAAAEDTQAMLRAIAGERCLVSDVFSRPDEISQIATMTGSEIPLAGPLFLLYRASGLLEQDHLCYLELKTRYVEALELPLPKRLQAAKAVGDEVPNLPKYRVLTRALFPALSRTVQIDIVNIARLRTCLAAVAAQRYRLTYGKLPERLSQLVPAYLDAVPEDPFDGQPLRYKKLAEGYVVYSIGHDGKDDGGKEVDKQGEPDVTFTLEP